MHLGLLVLELHLPGCASLKEKRGRLKPLLAGLQREFRLTASEVEAQDSHTRAVLACALVANQAAHVERVLARVPAWIESRRPDVEVVDEQFTFR